MITIPKGLPVHFDRKFHLARYIGSHSQLLIRSGHVTYHAGQLSRYDSVIDILFKDVTFMATSDSFNGLDIAECSESEVEILVHLFSPDAGDRKFYALRGEGSTGYVVAGAVYWIDDSSGSMEQESALLEYPPKTTHLEVSSA